MCKLLGTYVYEARSRIWKGSAHKEAGPLVKIAVSTHNICVHSEFHSPSDEPPIRVVFRHGNRYYRMVDIQIKDEGRGMSVYLKPPSEYLYISKKPASKLNLRGPGPLQRTIKVENPKETDYLDGYFNPYMSWHGSGRLHTNGYKAKDLKRVSILEDSPAPTLGDIAVPPHILFTAIMPLSALSHGETIPPPTDFNENYYEISNNPVRRRALKKKGSLHIVVDRACLKSNSLVLDVMVHNKGVDVDFTKNHPYPDNSEILWVSHPIKVTPHNINLPAVSLFFYQPTGGELPVVDKHVVTFWGRSNSATQDQMISYKLIV